jgi:hypothetical protein
VSKKKKLLGWEDTSMGVRRYFDDWWSDTSMGVRRYFMSHGEE